MTESNQGPATPGTAARCEALQASLGKLARAMRRWGAMEDGVPERFYPDYEEAVRLLEMANEVSAPKAPPEVPEIERLKAENASLLESLRAAEKERDAESRANIDLRYSLGAAEQRNTELEGALRLILDAMFVCYGGRKAMRGVWFKDSHDAVGLYDAARAALHDEERPPVDLMKELHAALKGRFADDAAATHDEERPHTDLAGIPPAGKEQHGSQNEVQGSQRHGAAGLYAAGDAGGVGAGL